jgi:hypothetical protein
MPGQDKTPVGIAHCAFAAERGPTASARSRPGGAQAPYRLELLRGRSHWRRIPFASHRTCPLPPHPRSDTRVCRGSALPRLRSAQLHGRAARGPSKRARPPRSAARPVAPPLRALPCACARARGEQRSPRPGRDEAVPAKSAAPGRPRVSAGQAPAPHAARCGPPAAAGGPAPAAAPGGTRARAAARRAANAAARPPCPRAPTPPRAQHVPGRRNEPPGPLVGKQVQVGSMQVRPRGAGWEGPGGPAGQGPPSRALERALEALRPPFNPLPRCASRRSSGRAATRRSTASWTAPGGCTR